AAIGSTGLDESETVSVVTTISMLTSEATSIARRPDGWLKNGRGAVAASRAPTAWGGGITTARVWCSRGGSDGSPGGITSERVSPPASSVGSDGASTWWV